jgi:hypothetical protein
VEMPHGHTFVRDVVEAFGRRWKMCSFILPGIGSGTRMPSAAYRNRPHQFGGRRSVLVRLAQGMGDGWRMSAGLDQMCVSSFPRQRASRVPHQGYWMPASAGMTTGDPSPSVRQSTRTPGPLSLCDLRVVREG